mgnify:CR=1 FL=1
MELVLIIDAAVRASARNVTAVVPYFGYGRQDRKDRPRVPVSSKVMVDLFTTTGAARIITMDLHSTQIQGFATIPFDHIYSRLVLLDAINSLSLDPDNSVVLSPDVGSARISQSYAKKLGMHFALIDKRRYAPNKAQVMHLIGDLDNKDVLFELCPELFYLIYKYRNQKITISIKDKIIDKITNKLSLIHI